MILAAAQLLAPGLLVWCLVPAVLAVALYLFKRRPRQVRVSTLPFFKSLAAIYQEAAWLRRLKKVVSFLLTAAVIAGAVLALARLVVAPKSDELQGVVLLIDGSASMGAKDAAGETRLARGKTWARARLAGLPPGVAVMVVRYDRRLEILLPFSYDRRAVERALEDVRVRPLPGDSHAALELAKRLAALESPAAIWHLTDQPQTRIEATPLSGASVAVPAASTAPAASASLAGVVSQAAPLPNVSVTLVDLGLAEPRNVGVTAVQVRPQPLEHGKVECFLEIQGAPVGDGPYETQIEVIRQGELVLLQRLSVKRGGVERLLLPIDSSQGDEVTIRISSEGDVLESDNVVYVRLPESRPVRVAWVTEGGDPFTQLALAAIQESGQLEVFQVPPKSWPLADGEDGKPAFDVVMFDAWLPDVWDPDLQAMVIDPPRPLGPIRSARLDRGIPLDSLRSVADGHPLLYGVASGRVAVFQTCILDAGGGLTPLWVGRAGPVLSAGEVRGQRLIVMGFSTVRSERLGYLASWPLLLGNAVLWLSQKGQDERTGRNLQTGEVLELETGQSLSWNGEDPVPSNPLSKRATLVELDRLGFFQAGDIRGSAALLSSRETNLQANPVPLVAAGPRKELPLEAYLRGDLRPILLWGILCVLLVEAWLFHRLGVF
ncbi:MAG: BatA and WFA domain-containing protein [Planctomycetes bacterium]|nr:BatA and WFA domain-containing protein [Planctomycetota bacterium]